jgi:hypothetical protein
LVIFSKYYYGAEIKKDEMGGTCSTHAGLENEHKISVGKSEDQLLD